MSESSSSNQIPTNEEVISELTKDLESQCIRSDDSTEHSVKESGDEETSDSQISPEVLEHNETNSDNEKNEEKPPACDDFVDEEALKELECAVTDEEREEMRRKSLEFKTRGNEEFRNGNYTECLKLYTDGLNLCLLSCSNDRAILYANRAAAKSKIGDQESAIEDCTKAIQLNENYVKALLRRAQLYENTDKLDEALEDYKKVLELDMSCIEARKAIATLPERINIRNEKMKEEMLGKLKDLGNMFLRPFGLSTDNFQMTKDPNTGGYSVNFSQNANTSGNT